MSDGNSRFELTRRRVLGSVVATGAAAAGVGAGTWAAFSDTESSSGNSVQAGTLDLTLSDSNSLQWSIIADSPGEPPTDTQDIVFHNVGSLNADHLELDFSNTTKEDDDGDPSNGYSRGPESDPTDGASGMAQYVRVETLTYERPDGTKLTLVSNSQPYSNSGRPDITNTNDTGFIDLDDLTAPENEDALDNFTPPPPNDSDQSILNIHLVLDKSTPNDYQGDAVLTEVTASLQQDSSQNS